LIQDQGELRNQDSKISLPGFHRFKFQFHSFFAETFSTVSVRFGHSAMSAQFPHCPKADVDPRIVMSQTCHYSLMHRTNEADATD
jgi:hypothetical protein